MLLLTLGEEKKRVASFIFTVNGTFFLIQQDKHPSHIYLTLTSSPSNDAGGFIDPLKGNLLLTTRLFNSTISRFACF